MLEPRRRLVQPGRAARWYMVVAAVPASWIRSGSDLPETARHRRQPRHHGHHVAVLCAQGAGCQRRALLPPLQRDHGARDHLVRTRWRACAAPEAALSGLAASPARRPRGRAQARLAFSWRAHRRATRHSRAGLPTRPSLRLATLRLCEAATHPCRLHPIHAGC